MYVWRLVLVLTLSSLAPELPASTPFLGSSCDTTGIDVIVAHLLQGLCLFKGPLSTSPTPKQCIFLFMSFFSVLLSSPCFFFGLASCAPTSATCLDMIVSYIPQSLACILVILHLCLVAVFSKRSKFLLPDLVCYTSSTPLCWGPQSSCLVWSAYFSCLFHVLAFSILLCSLKSFATEWFLSTATGMPLCASASASAGLSPHARAERT